MTNHYCFAKYTCLDLCHVKFEIFDAQKDIDLSTRVSTCVQRLLSSLYISVQFTEEICLYLGQRLERDLVQDSAWLTFVFCLAPASLLGMSLSRVSTSCDNSEI